MGLGCGCATDQEYKNNQTKDYFKEGGMGNDLLVMRPEQRHSEDLLDQKFKNKRLKPRDMHFTNNDFRR